jgi:glucuronoarabinoxylan endo-1,4-beta-xylanase
MMLQSNQSLGRFARVLVLGLLFALRSFAQTSTINWTATNQTIQGFGGSNAFASSSMSTANQNFFFGTGSGDLGLSILRVEIPDANSGNAGEAGSCATVNSACAGTTQGDMAAVVANGGIVVGSPWSPPAAYKSNGSVTCSSGDYLLTADYANFATWLVNWVKSMQTYASITPYGVSVQNEGDSCSTSYSTAVWTAATYDSFIATAMEPAWSSAGLNSTVKIMFPEMGVYSQTSWASTCAGDASCYPYVGVINWHDYDSTISGTNTVNSTPFSGFGWPNNNPQYWETEASCPGASSMDCSTPESATITDALNWGAVVDDRLVNENANAWMYWWIQSPTTDAQGLMDANGAISPRAYMLGQYSLFVRPGSVRITATHNPVSTVTVSAYRPPTANTIAIVATNYNTSSQNVTFTLTNAPTFTSLTPVITSSTQNMATLSPVTVTSQSFSYTLPAHSIITFSGTGGGGGGTNGPPVNLNGTVVTAGSTVVQ